MKGLSRASGEKLTLEPIQRKGNRVSLEGFDPCAVLVNNDLSAGIPAVLRGIEQAVVPPLVAGWSTRRKSQHFHAYDRVAEEFAKLAGIDPWVVNPVFSQCGKVNFAEKEGEDCLAANVEFVLNEVREKYAEYGITEQPFVIVKADAGTYGMGIMTVKSVDDVRNLNRKTRNKMATIKDSQPVHEVIIQEGVYTFESVDGAVAEPVVYMVDQFVVGGFYRVHTERGIDENLNSPGAKYVPLAFETDCHSPDCSGKPGDTPNRFYTYGVVARLAMLALLQVLSAVGNVFAAVIKLGVDALAVAGIIDLANVWRMMFLIGGLPIVLAVISALTLRETDTWLRLKAQGALPTSAMNAYVALFRHAGDRRNLWFGTAIASAGIIGLWAIGEYAIDLPRPRDVSEIRLTPRFIEMHREIWHAMKEEVLKGYAQQQRH